MFQGTRQVTSEAVGVFNNGQRERWEISQHLDLSDEQQFECHWIRSGRVGHVKELIRSKERKYHNYFAMQFHHGHQCGMSEEEKEAGIKRRLNIWTCAEMLGRDKPSKIAHWYGRKTGDQISRAVVSVQLKRIPQRLPNPSASKKSISAG